MNNSESAITRLIHSSAHYLDEQNYDAYVAMFADDGEYTIITSAPELSKPMIWMQRSKSELAERFAAAPKHEWQSMQQEQTRLVSVNLLDVESDTATASSNLAVFNTDEQGRSSCYVVGRYEDRWCKQNENWFLEQRKVVLKTRLLSMLTPRPI